MIDTALNHYAPSVAATGDMDLPRGLAAGKPAALINGHSPEEVVRIGTTGTPKVTPVKTDLPLWVDASQYDGVMTKIAV